MAANLVSGVDVSFSRVSATWCAKRKAEGERIFVQDLWTGGYANNAGLNSIASLNLRDAREAGLITAGYANANPWFSAAQSVAEAKKNASAEWPYLDIVFVDVEIKGVTIDQVKDLCSVLKAEGKRVAIYSGQWFWKGQMGDPRDAWLKEYKIWNANYDDDPDIDFAKAPWGPWTQDDIIGEQYGSCDHDGVTIDRNTFDLNFFEMARQPAVVRATSETAIERKDDGDMYVRFETGNAWSGAVFYATAAGLQAVYDGSLVPATAVKVLAKGSAEYESYKKLPTFFAQGNPVA